MIEQATKKAIQGNKKKNVSTTVPMTPQSVATRLKKFTISALGAIVVVNIENIDVIYPLL